MERVPKNLYHGSPNISLTEIVPGKREGSSHPNEVFASALCEVATLFTLSPDTVRFMIDVKGRRIFIPDADDFLSKDNGGAIYTVAGDFRPAPDKNIFEYWAPKAIVKTTHEIDKAVNYLTERGYTLLADPDVFRYVVRFWEEFWRYPQDLPKRLTPVNK
jgi:hypothetical protein